jgi:inorganic pyrophosphatase
VQVDVVIEVPQGSRNKSEMDSAAPDAVHLHALPADCGLIPGTLAGDGDPLDAMDLPGDPVFRGTRVTARPVAASWMPGEHAPDARILTVTACEPRHQLPQDLPGIPAHPLAGISQFSDAYTELEPGKSTDARGWPDRDAAEQVITAPRAPQTATSVQAGGRRAGDSASPLHSSMSQSAAAQAGLPTVLRITLPDRWLHAHLSKSAPCRAAATPDPASAAAAASGPGVTVPRICLARPPPRL